MSATKDNALAVLSGEGAKLHYKGTTRVLCHDGEISQEGASSNGV